MKNNQAKNINHLFIWASGNYLKDIFAHVYEAAMCIVFARGLFFVFQVKRVVMERDFTEMLGVP